MSTSCRVAVVGAGAAGLATAQQMRSEGHSVVVFEQSPRPGGVWLYHPSTDDALLGEGPGVRVHSSMYRDLRTNLPREIMGFRTLPFIPEAMGGYTGDPRRFCSHEEVASYLQLYADMHQLHPCIQYSTQVSEAVPLPGPAAGEDAPVTGPAGPRWRLTVHRMREDGQGRPVAVASEPPHQQEFDALMVCNGHYSEPNLPDVPGADAFPGLLMHSHNYRSPDAFAGQTVVVVGASLSGDDICREIGDAARRVLLAARSWRDPTAAADPTPFGRRANIARRGMVTRLLPDGGAEFEWGEPAPNVDAVIYCTGYRYSFPFLDVAALGLSTADQRVAPLYEHMWAPSVAPTLAFVGLPWKVVPFPLFEGQARLAARVLAGRAALPARAEMRREAAAFYAELERAGVPARHSHMMGQAQWAYNERLLRACGDGDGGGDQQPLPPMAEWRYDMYVATSVLRLRYPGDYRDRWDEEELAALAVAQLRAEAGEGKPPAVQQPAAGDKPTKLRAAAAATTAIG